MATTILAVDDSVTMRKVLEITFAGPEFRCITVPGADAALDKLKNEKPALVVADVTLEGKNGYDLCKAIKQASPSTPVLILSSKQNPYDSAKGSAAQADEYMDKPYDSTQMLDKVRKLLAASGSKGTDVKLAPETPKVAQAPAAKPVAAPTQPVPGLAASPPAGAAAPQRAKTMLYNPGGVNTPTTANQPALKQSEPAPKPAAALAAAAAPTNGQMQAQLEALGLTPTQVEGVLALSREVIERVVWEVVPVLAETLIKEEIARLTK